MSVPVPEDAGRADVLHERRLARERAARKEAERLLERKSLALFEALQASERSQRRLELALWASGESIWEWVAETDLVHSTRYVALGAPPQETSALLIDVLDAIHPADVESVVLAWRLHLAGSTAEYDMQYRLRDGLSWRRSRGRVIEHDAAGIACRMVGTTKDITRQREQDESLRVLGHAFANSRDALVLCDASWRVLESNAAFHALSGFHHDSARRDAIAPLLPALIEASVREGTGATHLWVPDCRLQVPGANIPVDVSATMLPGTGQRAAQWIVSIKDLREAKRLEIELATASRIDALTGLINRAAGMEALLARIADAGDRPVPTLWLNLDEFKVVNDGLGAREADGVLSNCAGRALGAMPEGWLLARWGGDELLAIGLPGQDAQYGLAVGQSLLAALAEPLAVAGTSLSLTASAGLAVYPEDGESAEVLVLNAGTALRHAKRRGRARLEAYEPSLDEHGLQRLRMVSLLRRACDRDDFRFVAQPRVDAMRRIVGYEVLVRWHSPELGWVSPAQFIPLAEENGLIDRIGRAAIRAAVALAVQLRRSGRPAHVSVNLAAKQLQDPMLGEVLRSELAAGGGRPEDIELEVTESGLVQDIEGAHRLLTQLRSEGFTLALDDFGTGYSSLSYLQTLPFHKVKLDRSFVKDVVDDHRAARLIAGVVDLCSALEMQVVAEGVETEGQFARLVALGAPEFQGFLFHRPLDFDAIARLS
jgi:diguanylate cyclase (GGDEF)-like protein